MLGPLLFMLLINDIDMQLEKCKILLYVDDTVKSCEFIQLNLNADLSKLTSWFSVNKLVVNLNKGKTEFMLFGTSKKLSKSVTIEVKMNETNVSEVDSYEYPGVLLDKSLNYNKHIHKMIKKASGRISCYNVFDKMLVRMLLR